MRKPQLLLIVLLLGGLLSHAPAYSHAQAGLSQRCTTPAIQPRAGEFTPGGIILTSFDADNLWVYDIAGNTRYPLPQTRPCTSNCHLSPDARWLSYLNPDTFLYNKMRLDGTQRTPLVSSSAADVRWWSAETLLVWTPDHRAYLRPEDDPLALPDYLPVRGVRAVQPGGRWGVLMEQNAEGDFVQVLLNLETRGTAEEQRVFLTEQRPFFDAAAWSPDGRYLAYVGRSAYDESVGLAGGEIFLAQPGSAIPQQATFLFREYGAVRINGHSPGALSWSPDGRYLAFWVIELLGANPEANTGNAVIHVLDVRSGQVVRYCGYATTQHTPNPPRLVWSPDSTHLAFAGAVPGDPRGALLLALTLETGALTELSAGVYPALGIPDVTAWGHAP